MITSPVLPFLQFYVFVLKFCVLFIIIFISCLPRNFFFLSHSANISIHLSFPFNIIFLFSNAMVFSLLINKTLNYRRWTCLTYTSDRNLNECIYLFSQLAFNHMFSYVSAVKGYTRTPPRASQSLTTSPTYMYVCVGVCTCGVDLYFMREFHTYIYTNTHIQTYIHTQ